MAWMAVHGGWRLIDFLVPWAGGVLQQGEISAIYPCQRGIVVSFSVAALGRVWLRQV